jgi:hypothetical protein
MLLPLAYIPSRPKSYDPQDSSAPACTAFRSTLAFASATMTPLMHRASFLTLAAACDYGLLSQLVESDEEVMVVVEWPVAMDGGEAQSRIAKRML